MTLTLRRLQFIDEYMIDRNGTQAAIRAGYSAKAAGKMAHTLLSDYRVRAEIERRAAELSERASVSAAQVIEKLAAIVNANIGDYLVAGPDGQLRLDIDKLKSEQASAVQDVVTESGARIRMHDKISAADKLLRHLGGYKDRIEHTGPDGGPIEVGLMTDEERLDALRELIARVKARVAGETSL